MLSSDQSQIGMLNTHKYFQIFCYLPEAELKDAGLYVKFSELVDLTNVEELRRAQRDQGDLVYTYTTYLIRAVADSLVSFEYANRRVFRSPLSFLSGPSLQKFESVDIAVAAEWDMKEVPSAAFVDVLRGANQKSSSSITHWLSDLYHHDSIPNLQLTNFKKLIRYLPARLAALLATLPKWVPSLWVKYRGGSVLISSPGKYGVDSIQAVWAWPIGFSFGFVKKRAVVKANELTVVPSFYLTMSFDRRIMAGASAARFFKHVVDNLQNPGPEK